MNELIRNTYMFVKKEVNERFNYVPTLYCVFAAMAIMTVISVIITFFIIQSVFSKLKISAKIETNSIPSTQEPIPNLAKNETTSMIMYIFKI